MVVVTGQANLAGKGWREYQDLIIAGLVIAIVMIIVIPLPPFLLDLLLTFSLAFGLVIMLTTMFTTHPLQFSVFPSLLLVATLYRLSLNVSSTRLILSQGSAGQVIQAFGEFVVGGNYVVGLIIFLIITIIQFVVITNGAGRVAEVAARFTLDAMPGKQMSIDADLNSGLIDEDQARERRQTLQREADFYGAMDGASKFVKGDAIAGLIITAINILGGMVVGVWQLGLPLPESLQTFTRLTVGDGLASQLPSLLISTATGVMVTRAGSTGTFGHDLISQLTAFPRVIALAAGILAVLGFIPGLPTMPFLVLAGGTGYVAYALGQETKQQAVRQQQQVAQPVAREPENVLGLLQVDPLEIEIGYNLIPLTDSTQGGDLLERVGAVRRRCATDLGLYVRPIRIRDNLQLKPNQYLFKLRGEEVAGGEVIPGSCLAMNPMQEDLKLPGIATREPTFGLPAWWVNPAQQEQAEMAGCTVVDAVTVLITHLTEFIKEYAHELLGRQEVKELLEKVKEQYPAVVEEVIPEVLTVGQVQRVFQNLLQEQIPLRDVVTLLEVLADQGRQHKDSDYLTEACRQSLARTISRLLAPEGRLYTITLDPLLEKQVADSLQMTQEGNYPTLAPDIAHQVLEKMGVMAESMALQGRTPVVLCSSRIRLPLRRLIRRFLPKIMVVAYNELLPNIDVEVAGTVTLA